VDWDRVEGKDLQGAERTALHNYFMSKTSSSKVKQGGGEGKRRLLLFRGTIVGGPSSARFLVVFMIDSGATSNFIADDLVTKLKLDLQENNCSVIMPDGREKESKGSYVGKYSLLPSSSNGIDTQATVAGGGDLENVFEDTDTFVSTPLQSDAFSVILGMPWLDRIDPSIQWRDGKMTITKKESTTNESHKEKENKLEFKGVVSTAAKVEDITNALKVGGEPRSLNVLRSNFETWKEKGELPTEGLGSVESEASSTFRDRKEERKALLEKAIARRTARRAVQAQEETLHLLCALNEISVSVLAPKPLAQRHLHGSAEQMKETLVKEFADVFPDSLPPLPIKNRAEPGRPDIVHIIELIPGSKPFHRPMYRMAATEHKELKEQLDEGETSGRMSKSTSPWSSPVLLLPKPGAKPGDQKRLVVDFRGVNDMTKKNSYAIPLMDDLFDKVQGAQYFSKIDLRTGFWQIALDEKSREYTAFNTPWGLYHFNVLPMGLTNAPATFMHLMNETFRDYNQEFVLVFLDDIVIYSKTLAEHHVHVRKVLQRLRDKGLYAKGSKCTFFQREVTFLGYRLGTDGLRVMEDKVAAINNWPKPICVKDVRSFLGLASFYRRFVPGFSEIAAPLTELTLDINTKKKFVFTEEAEKAMEILKQKLTHAPVLVLPDMKLPFVLHADASGRATAGVLQQDQTGKGLQPLGYLSTKMTAAEKNYAVREQELLAVMHALRHWRHLLLGKKFTVHSDHNSLRYLMTQPTMKGRHARWQEELSEYEFDILYVKGKENVVADALSRRSDLMDALGDQDTGLTTYSKLQQLRDVARRRAELAELESAVEAAEGPLPPTTEAALYRLGVRATLKIDEEVRRLESIRQYEKIIPVGEQDPTLVPNAGGTIMTATQRCVAKNAKGNICGCLIKKGAYCPTHLSRDHGLRIGLSRVPGAGYGLFTTKDFLKDELITAYTGDLKEGGYEDPSDPTEGGPYQYGFSSRKSIDAARINSGPGRWINDSRGSGNRANTRFVPNPQLDLEGLPQVTIRTTRAIQAGEELYIPYGADYWRYYGAKRSRKRLHALGIKVQDQESQEWPGRKVKKGKVQGSWKAAARFLHYLHTFDRKVQGNPWLRRQEGGTLAPHFWIHAMMPVELKQGESLHALDEEKKYTSLELEIKAAVKADADYVQAMKDIPLGKNKKEYEIRDELMFLKGSDVLVIPKSDSLRTKLLSLCHDTPTSGHLGKDKTQAEVGRHFYWPGWHQSVHDYVVSCLRCQLAKTSSRAPPGFLAPLPIPEAPWEHWSLDLIGPLPQSKSKKNAILVVVDRLTKMKHFIATKMESTAMDIADHILKDVIRLHGLPISIVSDRDPRFTAKAWKEFWDSLNVRLDFSTAYRPQTDGQTERENRTLESVLRSHGLDYNLKNWEQGLSMAELALNSVPQASTKFSPFYLNYGREVRKPLDLALQHFKALQAKGEGTVEAAQTRLRDLAEAIARARNNIRAAQARQALYADRGRRQCTYKVGDLVLMSTEHIQFEGRTDAGRKLADKYIGPFKVEAVVNSHAYKLELPPTMHIHPTININYLKPFKESGDEFKSRPQEQVGSNDRLKPPAAIITEDNGAAEWEYEKVLSSRYNEKKKRKEWLIKWKDWPIEEATWEPKEHLEGTDLDVEYEKRMEEEQKERESGLRRSERKKTSSVASYQGMD